MKSPIFILGSHKSGSSLLRSLLDGHPDLFAIPMETHFFELAGFWIDYHLRAQKPGKISNEKILVRMVDLIKAKNIHNDPFADSITPNLFDIEIFESYMAKDLSKDITLLFSTYLEALYLASNKTDRIPPNIRFVEKSVENAEYAFALQKMFSGAYFIHIIRNPYTCIKSIRKSKLRYGYPYLGQIIQALKNSYYSLYKNEFLLEKLMIVKYEDLVDNPTSIMNKVAEFLNIKFEDILTKPTLMGNLWTGNSTSSTKFSAISKQPKNSSNTDIEPIEIYLVNQVLSHVIERFDYPRMDASLKQTFPPSKGESIKTYIRNRSFEFSLIL